MSGRCHCSRAGRMEQALSYATRARATTEAIGDARLRAWCGMEAEPSFSITYLHVTLAQLHVQAGDTPAALAAARKAIELADQSRFRLEQGAARRVLGTVLAAAGHREDAHRELRTSLEILDEIQSRPELAQTLLAYGRFKLADDAAGSRAMIERALRLFEDMGATGWIDEARTTLAHSAGFSFTSRSSTATEKSTGASDALEAPSLTGPCLLEVS